MKFDLDRMVRVMSSLQNPQQSYPSIHVAGTNGKGSVSALIASVLREAGYRVGLYTSPHLEYINERFQINCQMIPDRELDRLSQTLIKKFPHLTQFEFLTAIAFFWFAEQKVDIAVIETGLGGRLDAPNVLRRVLVSVITNIDLDHTDWLGKTTAKIAREKAGIIKPGVPVVTAATGEALTVIKSAARKKKSVLRVVIRNNHHFKSALEGEHQEMNAAIAGKALHEASKRGIKISWANVREGFKKVRWPGRFEKMGTNLFLDGAHNPAGCRVLAQVIKKKKIAPVNLMFGALKDKDIKAMARELSAVTAACVTVPVASNRSVSAEELANLREWRGKARPAASVAAGWKVLNSISPKRPRVIAGSLYLVGDMRRRLK